MNKSKSQWNEHLITQLNKIAASLSDTGRHSYASMVFFPQESPYDILKVKEWLFLHKNNKPAVTFPDRSWYSLDGPAVKDAAEEISQRINEKLLEDVMKMGKITMRKDSFKTQPNGKR